MEDITKQTINIISIILKKTNYMTKQPEELIRADMMLNYFKTAPNGVHHVSQQQTELIKRWFWELENHTGCEFTFNDNYSKLRKDERATL